MGCTRTTKGEKVVQECFIDMYLPPSDPPTLHTDDLLINCEVWTPRLTQITPQLLNQWACKSTLITSVEGQSCFKLSVYDLLWIYLWAHKVSPHCEKSPLNAWSTFRIMIRKENPDIWENCAKWWWRWNIEGKYLQTLQFLIYLNALPHSGCQNEAWFI